MAQAIPRARWLATLVVGADMSSKTAMESETNRGGGVSMVRHSSDAMNVKMDDESRMTIRMGSEIEMSDDTASATEREIKIDMKIDKHIDIRCKMGRICESDIDINIT